MSFKNLKKIHGNTFIDKLSREINFTEIRYDLIAQMAIKLRHIMHYYGLEQKLLIWVHNQTPKFLLNLTQIVHGPILIIPRPINPKHLTNFKALSIT